MKGPMPFYAIILLAIIATIPTIQSHREHKVHNIVLYPDKHSWCKTLPIKQVISYPGCKSEEIDNNVCVGACFSYSIPHTYPSDPGEVIVPYCDSCQPSETTWHHVTLECNKDNIDTPPQLIKRVQIITNCSCSSCDNMNNHGRESDDDEDLLLHYNDVPDLLNVLHLRNETNTTISTEHSENVKNMMNNKIVTLLQNIQEKNSQYDKMQLIELLQMIQGPEKKLSDKSLANFVDSLSSEHIELDVPRLKEILLKFEHSKLYEKHRKYGLGPSVSTASSISSSSSSSSSGNNGVDNSDNSLGDGASDDIEGSHLGMGYLKGSHIGMGIHHSNGNDDTNEMLDAVDQHFKTEHNMVHHNHHVSGESFGYGHLIKGPHGALVIEPNSHVHEKLDVNPHDLKLNHAGTLVSYGSHVSDKNSQQVDD